MTAQVFISSGVRFAFLISTATLPAAPVPPAATTVSAAPQPAPPTGREPDQHCQLLVIGGGPGGYSAAFRAADLGLSTVIVERYPVLGGVCLNVGCIPSKALLHVASLMDEARALAAHGIAFGEPQIDLAGLRGWKDQVVGKLTGGLAGMARARKVDVVRGVASFVDAHHVEVELTEGSGQARSGTRRLIRFEQAIIAVGSQPVRLPFLPEDPRIVHSTGALAPAHRPKGPLVLGGGINGPGDVLLEQLQRRAQLTLVTHIGGQFGLNINKM